MADVTDMRGYIEVLEQMGELRRIKNADLKTEVGALTELAADKEGPALLFSDFKGYPAGFRVISNVFRTCKRTGPAMGISEENGIDYLYAWRKKLAAYKPVPVNQLEGGPILENQMVGERCRPLQISHAELARPGRWTLHRHRLRRHHQRSGQRRGQYRYLPCHGPGQEPRVRKNEYGQTWPNGFRAARDAGKALPVAITLCQGPAIFLAAQMPLPPDVNEFEFAGYLQVWPVPVVRGAATGLPIPANAEIVLEGEILPMKDEEMPKKVPSVNGQGILPMRISVKPLSWKLSAFITVTIVSCSARRR